MMAVQGDPRPCHAGGKNRKHHRPTAAHQPKSRRQPRHRRRVPGGKGAELIFSNRPMRIMAQTVKSLRHLRTRTRPPGGAADDGRRKTGEHSRHERQQKQAADFTAAAKVKKQNQTKAEDQQRRPVPDSAQEPGKPINPAYGAEAQGVIHRAVQRKGGQDCEEPDNTPDQG